MNTQAIRAEVHRFIADRLNAKLEKCKADESDERAALRIKHEPTAWLEDAAKRAPQIKLVTHSLKAIHPDARGTVVNLTTPLCEDEAVVGTHTLRKRTDDVVGNAAALDVFKLLKLEIDGETLLARLLRGDRYTIAALADDPDKAHALADSLLQVASNEADAASTHTLAKQMYFPVAPGEYHLLAPLFPTALAHHWFEHLRQCRERAIDASEARKADMHFEGGYQDYPGLALISLGGSKPQNISQLNSERGGKVQMLASGPPVWRDTIKPPSGDSVFDRDFPNRPQVRELTTELRDFLVSVRGLGSDAAMRSHRAALVEAICDEFMQYVATLYMLQPGWSQKAACQLSVSQRVALDPLAQHDEDDLMRATEWPQRIASDFAAWLNAATRTDKSPMGEVEEREWRLELQSRLEDLADNLQALREELADNVDKQEAA
jgi:CRISPR-associated protein Csy1